MSRGLFGNGFFLDGLGPYLAKKKMVFLSQFSSVQCGLNQITRRKLFLATFNCILVFIISGKNYIIFIFRNYQAV